MVISMLSQNPCTVQPDSIPPNLGELIYTDVALESVYLRIVLTTFLDQHYIRYTQNGILHMLDRNKRIKAMPERFQDTTKEFDVIFTAEERIYDAVVESKQIMCFVCLYCIHVTPTQD